MFKKPLAIQTKQVVGNKDRKLLKKQLQQKFPDQPATVINYLVPEQLWAIKGVQGLKAVVYCSESGPLFFDYDGNGEYFPTLLSLIQFPELLPAFVIYHPASSYILKGANVMLPSIVRPVSSLSECYGGLEENKRMSVRVYGNPIPFCVGICLVSDKTFFEQKGKALKVLHMFGDQLCTLIAPCPVIDGFSTTVIKPTTPPSLENPEWYQKLDFVNGLEDEKAVNSYELNAEGSESEDAEDEIKKETTLLESKKSNEMNEDEEALNSANELDEKKSEVSNQETTTQKKKTDEQENEKHQTSGNDKLSVSFQEIDKFLELLLLHVLHADLADSACPMSISAVFSKMNQHVSDIYEHPECKKLVYQNLSNDEEAPCIASLLPLDIKKSSYKKITKFFQHYSKLNLLTLKKGRGEDLVVSVRRESQLYKSFKVHSKNEDGKVATNSKSQHHQVSASKAKRSESQSELVIVDCYQAKSSAASTILEGIVPQIQNAYYSLDQCKNAILNYIDQNQLNIHNDLNSATLDSNLAQVCMTKIDRKKLSEDKHLSFDDITMPIDTILTKFIESLQPFHGVSRQGSASMSIYKDKLKPIELTVEVRQRRRNVTLIKNFHSFNVDEKLLTEVLQKTLASSANTFVIPGTTKKGVMVQGSFLSEVKKILTTQFSVPQQYISTL